MLDLLFNSDRCFTVDISMLLISLHLAEQNLNFNLNAGVALSTEVDVWLFKYSGISGNL